MIFIKQERFEIFTHHVLALCVLFNNLCSCVITTHLPSRLAWTQGKIDLKMESPNLGKYMNLHLEIGTAPMHFLAMDTIKIREADSAYKFAFTLIDMLTNYVFIIPIKDICGKTLVHKYIYKVYLPFGRMEKFMSDSGTSFINEHWRNLAKILAFTHIQSSPRNLRANGRIKNVHNFLKRTMKEIRHNDKNHQMAQSHLDGSSLLQHISKCI